MRRSKYRRASEPTKRFSGRRRIIAAATMLVVFGGIVTVSQVSDASTIKTQQKKALSACDNVAVPPKAKLSLGARRNPLAKLKGKGLQHPDDGAGATVTAAEMRDRCRQFVQRAIAQKGGNPFTRRFGNNRNAAQAPLPAAGAAAGASTDPNVVQNGADNAVTLPAGAGLDVLAADCSKSQLPPHDGFQNGGRCVSTAFGEVGAENQNPSLLITQAPRVVAANTPFTMKVSTRNLIRDRFLAAGKGGYYVESSVLKDGLERGHFHTACRMLTSTDEAPAPEGVPAFFVATEDEKGGAVPDTVTISVPGLPDAGVAQCASWAGDGSHRIPMMQRANQTPAFDAVRIQVLQGR